MYRWEQGRRNTGYWKLLLCKLFFFDAYLLHFPKGSCVPPHKDPVPGKKHYRLNLILKKSGQGGEFFCQHPIIDTERIKIFRSDIETHYVTRVETGSRWVLSIGIAV